MVIVIATLMVVAVIMIGIDKVVTTANGLIIMDKMINQNNHISKRNKLPMKEKKRVAKAAHMVMENVKGDLTMTNKKRKINIHLPRKLSMKRLMSLKWLLSSNPTLSNTVETTNWLLKKKLKHHKTKNSKVRKLRTRNQTTNSSQN